MIRRRQPPLGLCAALAALAALAPAGGARADLASNSPFLPAGQTGSAGAPGAQDPVELKGIMEIPGAGTAYCIYDTVKKTSNWVGLNETGYEYVVKSADAANDTVTVSMQGHDIRLALKASKVTSAGAGSSGAPVPPGASGGPNNPVVLNPNPADEQRRLDAVANEVRRRRQEREKAQAAGAQPQPAPAIPNR